MAEEPLAEASAGVAALAACLASLRRDRDARIVGLTGSVAAGKTTLAGQVSAALVPGLTVDSVSTDGFLFPNAVLQPQGLLMRKGFPETYDRAGFTAALASLRQGEADFPAHSHVIYDIDPALTRTIHLPDILILEGLGFQPPARPDRTAGDPDVLIYLDASEADLEYWYVERFVGFWEAARTDPKSFYAQWLHMSEPELRAFAKSVWDGVNLPNLRDHIHPLKAHADIVVSKDRGHTVAVTEDRIS
ncbi:type I pantothenate kinase [Hyphomonas johnsonii]|uniref:Pantothenate kinase n=1 Tax=Hyphomonas johnsonii MHS-2 TaxID=1280950 RepID=A0A059FHG6_9PROT|nr:type I pantothenate kinase [Hyphomonas johnsonii]KCZ90032.1 pantothenate kinase [Hyphomonas johnsonii MHS-2]